MTARCTSITTAALQVFSCGSTSKVFTRSKYEMDWSKHILTLNFLGFEQNTHLFGFSYHSVVSYHLKKYKPLVIKQ